MEAAYLLQAVTLRVNACPGLMIVVTYQVLRGHKPSKMTSARGRTELTFLSGAFYKLKAQERTVCTNSTENLQTECELVGGLCGKESCMDIYLKTGNSPILHPVAS